jgi:hypothetical protein
LDPGRYERKKLNRVNSRTHLACLELSRLGGVEILQVLVVGPHDEWVFRPLQPVSTFLQRHLHSEKLTIPHIVVIFHGFEVVGDIRNLGLHHELTGRVRMNTDGSCGEVTFEVPEQPVSSWRPRETNFGRGECRQGGSQGAVTPDKAAIEVDEPQEALQLHP